MRLRHIDRIRAVAVLCMVEVHTAAILPPKGMTVGDPGAFIAAAFGGMAAPLFVMISGWGIHKSAVRRSSVGPTGSTGWVNWIVPRLAVLVFCQLLVNVLLNVERGGRFEWHTPGVLTLLAFASLVAPLLVRLTIPTRASLLLMMAVSPIILGDASGLGWTWWDRVSSEGSAEWIARLLWNGTYPVVPWMFYIILGTLLHDTSGNRMIRERFIAIGIGMTMITIIFSFLRGIPWALTEGNAVLTFFPASTAFLVVSGTFALLLHRILEGDEADGGDPWKGDLSLIHI